MKILEYSFEGTKNIDKMQTIKFLNRKNRFSFLTESDLFDLEENNIKAIFGLNGSGKSATLYPLYVLKYLALNKFVLENSESKSHDFLSSIINSQSKKMKISITFLMDNIIYNIEITLAKDNDILYLENQLIQKKENLKNKRISKIHERVQSPTSYFILFDHEKISEKDFLNIYNFFDELVIINSEVEDLNFKKTVSIEIPRELIEKEFSKNDSVSNAFLTQNKNLTITNMNLYKKQIKFFELILRKTLKPDLKKIDVIFEKVIINQEEKKFIIKDIILNYGYVISISQESAGIKRLFNVFNEIFTALRDNKIIIIDEIDIYLHNDLITAIINYAIFYSDAQMIFTTHNLLMMDTLENIDRSILTIDLEQNISLIPRGGGISSFNKYVNGKVNATKMPINLHELYKASK